MNNTILTPEVLNEIKGNGYRVAIIDMQATIIKMAKAYKSPVLIEILTALHHEMLEKKNERCSTGNFKTDDHETQK